MFFRHVPRARMRLGQSWIRSRNSCNIHLWRSTHRTSASIVSSYVKVALLPTSYFSSSFLYGVICLKTSADGCVGDSARKANVGRIKSSLHSCIINHAITEHARKSLVGELRLCSGVGVAAHEIRMNSSNPCTLKDHVWALIHNLILNKYLRENPNFFIRNRIVKVV